MRMKRFGFSLALGLLATVLGLTDGTSLAGIISYDFSYTGTGRDGFGGNATDTGTGSFSFDDASNPAGLSALQSFSITISRTNNLGNHASFTYALGNVTSFAATFGPGGVLTALTLGTGTVNVNPGSDGYLPAKFQITSLTTGKMVNNAGSTITSGSVSLTNTTPAVASVPEPAGLSLLISGGAALGTFVAARRRRSGPSEVSA